ncbi:hypothetical protein FOL47_009523 [Perkinsus chesapeaki]|uniref:Peptidase A1 domain-containing protein n=1 Tax=Perkinsus chesapeaki TaxID=330153 RepID=A0A7J6MRQ0_PERCH|nr:hypothetical protein FOL47_009523 [Perkinsus chesapeaki]
MFDGQIVLGTVDTGAPSVRLHTHQPRGAFGHERTCSGDKCYNCYERCPRAPITAATDSGYYGYAQRFADTTAEVSLDGNKTKSMNIQHIVYLEPDDKRPGVESPVDTRFGLGFAGVQGKESTAEGLFFEQLYGAPNKLAEHCAFGIFSADSPLGPPGSVKYGLDPEKEGFFENDAFDFHEDLRKLFKDLRQSHYMGSAGSVAANFGGNSRTLYASAGWNHGPVAPFCGIVSGAPLVYVRSEDLYSKYIKAVNDALKRTGHFLTKIAVEDAIEGYTIPCEVVDDLPDWEFNFVFFAHGSTTRSFLIPNWATVMPLGDKRDGRCRWLFGAPKDDSFTRLNQNNNRPYVILGWPAFRANNMAFSFKPKNRIYFNQKSKPSSLYGSIQLALDYDMVTILTVDRQPLNVVADTSVDSIILLDKTILSEGCGRPEECYSCTAALNSHDCPNKVPIQYTDPMLTNRSIYSLEGTYVTIGATSVKIPITAVSEFGSSAYPNGYQSLGLAFPDTSLLGPSLLSQMSKLPLENHKQFSIYGQRSPTDALGILSLGGFRLPPSLTEGKLSSALRPIDNSTWPRVNGIRGYTTRNGQSTPFGKVKDFSEVGFASAYPLIYAPTYALDNLIDEMASALNKATLDKLEVKDAKQGWTVLCKDVKKLPDVHIVLQRYGGGEVKITFKPEDYTAPSTIDCGTCRVLFGEILHPDHRDKWFLGKPYFRNYYTQFDASLHKVSFARLDES